MERVSVHKAKPVPSASGNAPSWLAAPQRSGVTQRHSDGRSQPTAVPPIVHDVLRSPGQPLDAATRAYMEPRFGHDFSKVRVHADAKAAESASSIDARAFALGRDIVFGSGEYAPRTQSGRRLVAHELTHVVQQASADSHPHADDIRLQVGSRSDRTEGEAWRSAEAVASAGFAPRQHAMTGEAIIRRAPKQAPLQPVPSEDDQRLHTLWQAVKATAIGQTLLARSNGEPTLKWGKTEGGFHGSLEGGDTIVLNKFEKDKLNDSEWKQVIAMELGNFSNQAQFQDVYKKGEEGLLSKEEYVSAIDEIEYATRGQVIAAMSEFCEPNIPCNAIFIAGISLEQYKKDPNNAKHRLQLEQQWEEDFKWFYSRKQKEIKKQSPEK